MSINADRVLTYVFVFLLYCWIYRRVDTTCLPEVAHVEARAENAYELIFVIVNVSLHDIHAGSHQTLKCLHVQNYNKRFHIN